MPEILVELASIAKIWRPLSSLRSLIVRAIMAPLSSLHLADYLSEL